MKPFIEGFLLAAVAWLSGCQQVPREALVFGLATEPASLHPVFASDAVSERINALLYEPLVRLDSRQQPAPGLLRWQKLSDTRYLLFLRDGIPDFSDGSRPHIGDVQTTLQIAMRDPRSAHATTLSHVKQLTRLEAGGLAVELSRADPRFASKLHLGLAPAGLLRQPGKLADRPVGNGPFRFVSRSAQGNLLLERRSDGVKLRFKVIPDPTMRALELMQGGISILQNDLPHEMYPMLAERPGVTLQQSPGTTFSYLGFNLADPATGNLQVRRAIAHAIDRRAIIRYLFQGHARPANTLLHPGHWAAHPRLADYVYDPDKARELLAGLGYGRENPLKLDYKTSTDPFRLRIAAVLQAQLAEVGIELQIHSYEWGTFFGDIKAGNFQLYSLSWVGVHSPDIFRYVFHSQSLPPGGANRGRYHSEKADRLIEKADSLSLEKAARVYRELQALIHQELVYVPLWHESNLLVTRDIRGAEPNLSGGYRFLENAR